jgi:alpha-ribazole phosphatase
MELILLRHGATAGNLLHQYIGITDLPLAQEGIAQASAVRSQLPTPDLICSSPAIRCQQTAGLIWPDSPITLVSGLRETDFGLFEGKTWQELKDDPRYRAWIDGVGECPGGEPRQAVTQRIRAAWDQCYALAQKQQVSTLAVVTHGGVIMELMNGHLGGTFYDWQTSLCQGWRVQVNDRGDWSSPKPLISPPLEEV